MQRKRKRESAVKNLVENSADEQKSCNVLADCLQTTLSLMPKELHKLILETIQLPYEYTWIPRGDLFQLDKTKKIMSCAHPQRIFSTMAEPFLPTVSVDKSMKWSETPIPVDWIIHQPANTSNVFWTGICDSTGLNGHCLDISICDGVYFQVLNDGSKKVVISGWPSPYIAHLVVTFDEFVAHGLRFSMDYHRRVLTLSVGANYRSFLFSDIFKNRNVCAPFVSGYHRYPVRIESVVQDRSSTS